MARKRQAPAIDPDEPYLQIGEVAERTGVTQRTLRFYEEKGLLRPPTRMDGGFRLYSENDIQRLERIKRLKRLLGFPLAEIKEMVDAEEIKLQLRSEYRPESAISQKKAQLVRAIEVTEKQYNLIRQKVDDMAEMQSKLEERLETFRTWMEHLDKEAAASRKERANV